MTLALHGGAPVRTTPFPAYWTIGAEERAAVLEVIDSGELSGFVGTWSDEFYGGRFVQALERAWEQRFGVAHAVSMNSATSCLYAAIGAAGVGPGDEVIVPPFTMSASAAGPLVYGAVPVFADIDERTFCITAETIAARLTPRTKAIVVVDLFGQPAELEAIMALARPRGITVIEDAAQAAGATRDGRLAGTLADMGVFSLNRHKLIQSGEGGVIVTDDPELAERLQMIRNHGEVVAATRQLENIVNLVGFNFRMTELEAAVAGAQLVKLDDLLEGRRTAAAYLTEGLRSLEPMLTLPYTAPGVDSAWYLYVLGWDPVASGVPRSRLAAALQAEGIPVAEGYVEPIYLQPLYQRQIAIGAGGHPFTSPAYEGVLDYRPGLCPTTERFFFETLLTTNLCHGQLEKDDLDDVIAGFTKVVGALDELR